jgi:FkbM family methyltransferase
MNRSRRVAKGGSAFMVAAGERPDHDAFWDWYESPEWEPETVAVYAEFARPGARIVDVGGWIGPTVLLGAALGAEVLAVEPDPVAADALERNLALNPELARRVRVLRAAVDAQEGRALLVSPSPDGGDSLSHLASVRSETGMAHEVATVSLGSLLESVPAPGADLIKIDAEAAEYVVVPTLRNHIARGRPSLYVATHPNLIYDRRRRVRSGLRALAANRRLLQAVAPYRHHYAWREERLTDVRRENIRRLRAPLPVRSSFLIGAFLFTDRTLPSSAKGS